MASKKQRRYYLSYSEILASSNKCLNSFTPEIHFSVAAIIKNYLKKWEKLKSSSAISKKMLETNTSGNNWPIFKQRDCSRCRKFNKKTNLSSKKLSLIRQHSKPTKSN